MLQTLNGVLTNTSSAEGSSAGYTFANLGNPVSEIGGTFVLQSGKGGQGGAAGFILFNELANGLLTPDSAFHMAIFRKGWNLTYYLNNPVPFAAIDDPNRITSPTFGSGTFSSPLAADTTLTFSASFNIAAHTVTLRLPDGTTTSPIVLPNVPSVGHYACWEVFQQDASTDDKPAFLSIYAQ